jgi:hypothetical protein
VLKHLILAFQKENSRVTRIVINDGKNIPLVSHGANPRGTDSHHNVNRRMGSIDHLAMMTRKTNKVTLKLEFGQSSE